MLHFPGRLFFKHRLLAPLYTSFLLLVLLAVVQGFLNFWLEIYHQRTVAWVTHSLLIERETERLLSAVLDEQTSLRGYLITEDKTFLEPYRTKAQAAFQDSFTQLYALVGNQPTQRYQLDQIKLIYENWQRKFADAVLDGTASKTTLPGKTLFDPMRGHVNALLAHEEKLLTQRKQQLQHLSQTKTVLEFLSLGMILIGIAWNLWLLRRRIELPLRQLTVAGQAWREGKLEVRLHYSSPDEIGRLAEVLDEMAREIRDRQERSQQRNQQLEDLISALSHDLRTPLLAARTTLRSMLSGAFGPVNETWKEILEEYHQSNEDLLKLVEALLGVSRYEACGSKNLNIEPLNWHKILTQVATQSQASHPQTSTFMVEIAASLPTVYGDPLEIQRVLQNLLENAVRVSKPEEPIVLQVIPVKAQQVQVSVCDRGPGITAQEKERLFHRFIQGRGRRGGAGLGLYLCRQIIEAHGGKIGVDSIPNQGSTFWFTLPAVPTIAADDFAPP